MSLIKKHIFKFICKPWFTVLELGTAQAHVKCTGSLRAPSVEKLPVDTSQFPYTILLYCECKLYCIEYIPD